jgi:hypothetical protein
MFRLRVPLRCSLVRVVGSVKEHIGEHIGTVGDRGSAILAGFVSVLRRRPTQVKGRLAGRPYGFATDLLHLRHAIVIDDVYACDQAKLIFAFTLEVVCDDG